MEKYSTRLWLTALLLGWAADLLFWSSAMGINYVIFLTLCLVAGTLLLLSAGFRPARASLWLLLPLAFFLLMTVLRREPLSAFLAYTFTLFPLGILINTYLEGNWLQYRLWDYLKGAAKVISALLTTPLEYIVRVHDIQKETGNASSFEAIKPVLRGILIATPILFLFGSLLSSADLIFAQKIKEFFGLFDFSIVAERAVRFILILVYAYSISGVLYQTSIGSNNQETNTEQKIVIQRLSFTESSIVLGSIILLFGFFVVIQFRYFFGGNANINMSQVTYSSYARSGFNELVTVAFSSLVLILGLSSLTRFEGRMQKRIYSGLNIGVVGLVIVILISAYQRLMLAIDWHGYSRLRLYPLVFMIWLGILLIIVVVLEALDRQRHFAFAAVLASLGFALTISLMNVDGTIVHHNVWRALQGKHFNVSHLASLSSDAAPALVDEFLSPTLPSEIKEGVGAALVCQQTALDAYVNEDWRAFHGSDWMAGRALQKVQAQLADYHYKFFGGAGRVRTPGNRVYFCEDLSGD
ncbi:MAG: DUF4173 domain-containing protein [Chloroflexi bacterium]|nr:DUF4173 domain-containing protein [Chloroflexota bacterium]